MHGQLEKAKTFICIILQDIFTITIIGTSSYLLMFPRTTTASQECRGLSISNRAFLQIKSMVKTWKLCYDIISGMVLKTEAAEQAKDSSHHLEAVWCEGWSPPDWLLNTKLSLELLFVCGSFITCCDDGRRWSVWPGRKFRYEDIYLLVLFYKANPAGFLPPIPQKLPGCPISVLGKRRGG